MGQDKRHFPRINEETRVTCKVLEDPSAVGEPGLAMNISGGGICFHLAEKLPQGAMLALELSLPGFPAGVIALAKVVWCERNGARDASRPWEVGAEFHWIGWDSSAAQNQIAGYIRDKLTH